MEKYRLNENPASIVLGLRPGTTDGSTQDVKDVQGHLRHMSVKTTLEHYIK